MLVVDEVTDLEQSLLLNIECAVDKSLRPIVDHDAEIILEWLVGYLLSILLH